jgi:hypothetical protein
MSRKHTGVLFLFGVLLLFFPIWPDGTFFFPNNSTSHASLLSILTNLHAAVPSPQMAEDVSIQSSQASATTGAGTATVLLEESFEDTNFELRGWYDVKGGTHSTSEHVPGSTKSFECRFSKGGQSCNGGVPGRYSFTETDSVYVSYWINHSANWTGSKKPYHPHEFYLLTNQNSPWAGPAWSRLTAYIEENGGIPQLLIQDGQNIDKTKFARI